MSHCCKGQYCALRNFTHYIALIKAKHVVLIIAINVAYRNTLRYLLQFILIIKLCCTILGWDLASTSHRSKAQYFRVKKFFTHYIAQINAKYIVLIIAIYCAIYHNILPYLLQYIALIGRYIALLSWYIALF